MFSFSSFFNPLGKTAAAIYPRTQKKPAEETAGKFTNQSAESLIQKHRLAEALAVRYQQFISLSEVTAKIVIVKILLSVMLFAKLIISVTSFFLYFDINLFDYTLFFRSCQVYFSSI